MAENRKEAAERLRQLVNSNFDNDEVEISASYGAGIYHGEAAGGQSLLPRKG